MNYLIKERGIVLTDPTVMICGEAGIGHVNGVPSYVFADTQLTSASGEVVYHRFIDDVIPEVIDIYNVDAWVDVQLQKIAI